MTHNFVVMSKEAESIVFTEIFAQLVVVES